MRQRAAQLDVPGEVVELATVLVRVSALPESSETQCRFWPAGWWSTGASPTTGSGDPGGPQRYTHSLLTAASGLEGAAALVDQGVCSGDAVAWRQAAAAIAADIDATAGALEIHLDGGGADAALAQPALLGGLDFVARRIDPTST